ncbi:MAG: (Fe-S)-binding protein, partial [Gammaproteobacteria bacterium]
MSSDGPREGSLEAPTRHPVEWTAEEFYDETALHTELERVFDICHGCRRCFNLCNSFPTLFDAVDESETGELDSVPRKAYWEVVDHCYLCDMCFMSKCPYVPPHEWNVDFPHLMLRAKAKKFRDEGTSVRNRVLSSPQQVGALAGIPVVAEVVNAVNNSSAGRAVLETTLGVDKTAPIPRYHSRTARKRLADNIEPADQPGKAVGNTTGKVVLYTSCYGDRNTPGIVEDLAAVLEHNSIHVALTAAEDCCGMPKLELGDLESVKKAKEANIPRLLEWVNKGWDIVAP